MDARLIIAKLRDGTAPNAEELRWFANGLANGNVSDAQAGAFAMAAVLRGLGEEGRVALTRAMRDSGDVMSWDLDRPVVDKHSTGGIGDCVSLMLAPMLAACDVYVPMISGRGLGHTGGTLDKLEAIPGYTVDLSEDDFRKVVAETGCAIVAATGDLAPADKRLYAVRDVTATVESIDLITASILSKKLAAGLEALVLDVKTGSGAFMETLEDSRRLARALVETANGAGCKTRALITDMNQPLAASAGNSLEVHETIGALTGRRVAARLTDLSVELGAELLVACGAAESEDLAARQLRETLRSGRAAEIFEKMVVAQGGETNFLQKPNLPRAPVKAEVKAQENGYVCAMDGRSIGMAVVHLGGGRLRGGDEIDPSVGFSDFVRLGQKLTKGDLLGIVHAPDQESASAAAEALQRAISVGAGPVESPSLIHDRVI